MLAEARGRGYGGPDSQRPSTPGDFKEAMFLWRSGHGGQGSLKLVESGWSPATDTG